MSVWSEAVWLLNQIKAKIDTSAETIINGSAQVYVSDEETSPTDPTENSIWFVENSEET